MILTNNALKLVRRLGYDFDDSASYLRAALYVIPIFKHFAEILLGGGEWWEPK